MIEIRGGATRGTVPADNGGVARGKIAAVLRHSVRRRLRARGFDVVRYEPARFPELRRTALIDERGVDVVLDVGANAGPVASPLRGGGYQGRIVSFEPQRRAYERLAAAAAGDPLWEHQR